MTILFGAGKLICTPLLDAAGNAVANPTPIVVGILQDVSVDIDFESKMLHGEKQFAVAIGRGKAKIGWKAKSGDIDGRLLGSLLLGVSGAATRRAAVIDFAAAVPTTPFQITIVPPSSGTFVADLGVIDAITGINLTRVASAPAVGQYTVSGVGVYLFAAADVAKNMLISYEYTIASSTTSQLYNISNNLMGYTPTFSALFFNQYAGKVQVMKLTTNVLGKLSLPFKNDDFTMTDIDASSFADASGSVGYICQY